MLRSARIVVQAPARGRYPPGGFASLSRGRGLEVRRGETDAVRLRALAVVVWIFLVACCFWADGFGVGALVNAAGCAVVVALTVIEPGPATSSAKTVQRGRRGSGEVDPGTARRTIVAPMPGRIVKVLVKPGEAVSARQPLVVVEAMKMENELRAPRDGVVAEIRVAEGASVEANTVLLVLR